MERGDPDPLLPSVPYITIGCAMAKCLYYRNGLYIQNSEKSSLAVNFSCHSDSSLLPSLLAAGTSIFFDSIPARLSTAMPVSNGSKLAVTAR